MALLTRFRWGGGHADVWRVFADGDALGAVVAGLVAPWREHGVARLVGIESRGFLLGAAAVSLGVGSVAARKGDGLLPGAKVTKEAEEDYRGQCHRLRMQAVQMPATGSCWSTNCSQRSGRRSAGSRPW